MACERNKDVHQYHDGRMSPAERAAFERHLAGCPDCARLLQDLQNLSHFVVSARMPDISETTIAHYRKAWDLSRDRGVLRISSWLTAAAAALLLGSLVFWPREQPASTLASAPANAWEVNAMMPPPARRAVERPDELIELAQWMADDLSETVSAPGDLR
jgi:anti-sigma factor RsiW